MIIVVAWVQMSGLNIDRSRSSWMHGTSYTATSTAEAKAVIWSNGGTDDDVRKAREHTFSDRLSSYPVEWRGVLVYDASETDPLGRARADAMAAYMPAGTRVRFLDGTIPRTGRYLGTVYGSGGREHLVDVSGFVGPLVARSAPERVS